MINTTSDVSAVVVTTMDRKATLPDCLAKVSIMKPLEGESALLSAHKKTKYGDWLPSSPPLEAVRVRCDERVFELTAKDRDGARPAMFGTFAIEVTPEPTAPVHKIGRAVS